MPLDKDRYQKKLEKKISAFSSSFMSNSKWTRLFAVLSQHHDVIEECLMKSIFDDQLRKIPIPNFAFYANTFSDSGIKDVMVGGPSSFKTIEWIEFQRHVTTQRTARTESLEPFHSLQDIQKISDILDTVGQFAKEITEDKLIVYGYK